jgi:hypothetical protein
MKSDFVTDCFDCSRDIAQISGALSEIASCLFKIGSPILADSLWEKADKLNIQAEKVRKICCDKVHKDLENSQEASGNMLKAALAVNEYKNNQT